MATEIVMPEAGESVVSGVLTTWLKADGTYVERDEAVAEVDTDKITVEVPAPASGIIKHRTAEGDEIEIGSVIAELDESAAKPAAGSASVQSAKQESGQDTAAATVVATGSGTTDKSTATNGEVHATPLAKKVAAEKGVDLSSVQGTGASDRIHERDVLAAVQGISDSVQSVVGGESSANGRSRRVTLERMSPLRQKIASRLVEAQQTAAMLTTFNECDMSAVMDLRKQYKESFEKRHGIGLGFMSFFIKAAANALEKFPMVNASIVADDAGKPAIEKHDYADIAIAVASAKGLVVPVIRNCETLTFANVESAVKDFGTRARDGKLGLDEMQGGTFTITNGGIFGSLMSTPILNPPQSAILGMHTIKKRAMEHPVGSGQVAIRPMMYLALSYDHRIVDGAEAVQFLVSIKDAIEDPTRLLLDI